MASVTLGRDIDSTLACRYFLLRHHSVTGNPIAPELPGVGTAVRVGAMLINKKRNCYVNAPLLFGNASIV